MENYGLQIHGEEALEIYSAAGCDVDKSIDRVRFPRNLVNDSIESCPEEFTFAGP
jgi:trimethylamine:corrinoid methyltransferase-like protein